MSQIEGAYKKMTGALTHGTKALTTASKVVGHTLVKTADVMHLRAAINATTKYGRKGASRGMKIMRQRFYREYAGIDVPDALSDDEGDEEEEAATDAELLEIVDAKFFEKPFDAMSSEVSFLTSINAESSREMIGLLEIQELERKRQHNAVRNALKQRVLQRHTEFVDAVNQACLVRVDLEATSRSCVEGQKFVQMAKENIAARALLIPKLDRRRRNLADVQRMVDAMHALHFQYNRVAAHLDAGELCEAIHVLKHPGDLDMALLSQVASMQTVVAKWQTLTSSPHALAPFIFSSIDECIVKFDARKYGNTLDGVRLLANKELSEATFNKLSDSIQERARTVIVKSLTEVSNVKNEHAPLETIVAAIEPECLLSCMCKLCARLLDFLWLYAHMTKAHFDLGKSDTAGSDVDVFHGEALGAIKEAASNIKIHTQIGIILTSARLELLDADKALHIFHVALMLVEATKVLGSMSRDSIKVAAQRYLRRSLLQPQIADIIRTMVDDTWDFEPEMKQRLMVTPVILPMNPKGYTTAVEEVRKYLDEAIPSSIKNPFYSKQFLEPQNTSESIAVDMFQNTPYCDPFRAVATLSSERLCNFMFQTIGRVVVRLPPSANDTLLLFEDAIGAYLYITASAFVCFTKEIPLELQAHFSLPTRKILLEIRERSESIATLPRKDGSAGTFPPYIIETTRFKTLFANEAQYYGIANRATAMEAVTGVIGRYEAFISSVARLMPEVLVNERKARVQQLKAATNELLEVGLHYLCYAVISFERLQSDIKSTKFEHAQGKFVNEFLTTFNKFVKKITPYLAQLPSQHTVDLFWCRTYFSILETLIASIAQKKLSEKTFFNMSQDVQRLQMSLKDAIPTNKISVFEKYATNFFNSFLYDSEGRNIWLQENHTYYKAHDLVLWIGGAAPADQQAVEVQLAQLHHEDLLQMAHTNP